tara:strand:+ start:1354 stop:2373 length:1020 start_codon:yes stop_codon:yes gene_type:complete
MYKILLTGFEPFAGMKSNVSGKVADLLNSKIMDVDLGDYPIGYRGVRNRNPKLKWETEILTVDIEGSNRISDRVMSDSPNEYDAIIHLGLARNATIPRIETRALNLNKFSSPDNQGRIEKGEIIEGGPNEIFVTGSIDSIRRENLTIPFEFSNDAGGFVCNETLFKTLHAISFQDMAIPCLFIHLPSEELIPVAEQLDFVTRISAIVVQPRHVDVVGAMFEVDGKWLASRRDDKIHDGKWEFPGGKIESGETEEAALIRECKEELGWDIQPIERKMVIEHTYPNLTVSLYFWICTTDSKKPPAINSHSEHQWIETSHLHKYDWLEADLPLIKLLQLNND